MELSAVLTPVSEGGYIALNPETGTTTQNEAGSSDEYPGTQAENGHHSTA